MKTVLCFIFLFNICYCIDDENVDGSENYFENVNPGIYRGNVLKYEDHQAHGDHDISIIHPCSLDDLNCIRRVFAHNSKCMPVQGPAPDPYILPRLDLPLAQANLTFSLLNFQIKGLNEWKVNTFYINKATDRLLLEVVFDRIVVATPGARTTCHRKGKETIEEMDYSIIEYYGISFTLTIPHIKDLQLYNGQVFAYVADAAPLYTLGPSVAGNKDPDFIKCVASWLDGLDITMREVWAAQGPVFFSIFLQNNICDFKQNLPSIY